MSINPYESPQTPGESPQPKTGRWAPRLIEVLVALGAIAMLVALFLPARRTAREPARRTQCRSQLKQIAMALQDYESVHHALPPAYTVDAQGKPLHSWRTLILPFLEQQSLYDKIDLSKPWDDPANKAAFDTPISTYRCPSTACPATHTTYLAVVAPRGCFQPTQPRKLAEITDDQDLTLMVMELDADHAVHWMSPSDTTEQQVLDLGAAASLPHPGGAQAVFVSTRVVLLQPNLTTTQLRALVSIAGNDDAIAGGAK